MAMKNLLSCVVILLFSISTNYAQTPESFNYQAVVKNSSNELIKNQDVSVRISILQDSETGTSVYIETHDVTTSNSGQIGYA